MKCSKCGNDVANDSKFCEYCGAPIGSNINYKSVWILIALALMICVIFGILYYYESELSEYRWRMSEEENKMIILKSALQDEGYADLGLSSGTLWKRQNESGYYTFDDAKERYGEKLPSKALWEELRSECEWTWNGRGYDVVGPNGERISLPSGQKYSRNSKVAFYWSSLETDSETSSYCLFLGPEGVGVADYDKDNNFPVRLALRIDNSYTDDNIYYTYEEVVDTTAVDTVVVVAE